MTTQTDASATPGPVGHRIEVRVGVLGLGEPDSLLYSFLYCATCRKTLLERPADDGAIALDEANAIAAGHAGIIQPVPRPYRWAVEEDEIAGQDDQTLAAWLKIAVAASDTAVRNLITSEITGRVRQRAAALPVPSQGRLASAERPDEQVAGRQGHVCLACGCKIAQGLREIRVPGRRGGGRYRHADDADCEGALRAPQPNVALIGVFEALSNFEWGPARPPTHACPDESAGYRRA